MSAPAAFDPVAFLVEQATRIRARDAKLAPDPGALARTTALIQMIDGLLAKHATPAPAPSLARKPALMRGTIVPRVST